MSKHPKCHDCGRHASGYINVRGTRWEPDLQEERPGVWKCWKCRGEPHPEMHVASVRGEAEGAV